LFLYFKRRFLASRELVRRYPLDHLFLEQDYRQEDFCEFLDEFHATEPEARDVVAALPTTAVQFWQSAETDLAARLGAGTFLQWFKRLLEATRKALVTSYSAAEPEAPDCRVVGLKEIVCEEYVPYLLAHGVKVAVIVRHPLDVICSCNFGRGKEFAGEVRPTLFTLRQWRKSVAAIIAHHQQPGFCWLKYEDLVASPETELHRICRFLELSPLPDRTWDRPLRDQSGKVWTGNSSFAQAQSTSAGSVGRYRELLPDPVQKFCFTCCYPELRWLQYAERGEFDPMDLFEFREPWPIAHSRFEPEYSSNVERIVEEVFRLATLRSAEGLPDPALARPIFLYDGVYEQLRKIVTSG
jgi:hypothetical protein